jgi:hypothetical protein
VQKIDIQMKKQGITKVGNLFVTYKKWRTVHPHGSLGKEKTWTGKGMKLKKNDGNTVKTEDCEERKQEPLVHEAPLIQVEVPFQE